MSYTVCFCGTACSRDEGEETRHWARRDWQLWMSETRLASDKGIYCDETGYIPVRIHKEITNDLKTTDLSVTVRGVGENDWYDQTDNCDRLLNVLRVPDELLDYVRTYSSGNQRSVPSQMTGWSAAALALHGANLAAVSGADTYNFLGHSRGAVSCIMAAWLLYAYGNDLSDVPINIFAIDPVPGPGEWYGILTQLPPNVANYVGVYAWDHLDTGFTALVPRSNDGMPRPPERLPLGSTWKTLADGCQQTDPLAPGVAPQPEGYKLYACRGRHGTVAGNSTSDGLYDPEKVSESTAPVPKLVYKLARAYLTDWGTVFRDRCAVRENVIELRRKIHTDHAIFDAMGGGETRTSHKPNRPYVRRVSSIRGSNPLDTYYMDDVVGDPPYKLAYPVTCERTSAGWVNWEFL